MSSKGIGQTSCYKCLLSRIKSSTPRLPRCYAQRQKLRERWARHPLESPRPESSCPEPPSRYRTTVKKKKAVKRRKQRPDLVSNDENSSQESDSKSKGGHDSGYNSDSSNARAELLKQRRDHHEAAGLALSNLADKTKASMYAEEREWAW